MKTPAFDEQPIIETKDEMKETNTAFILLFPALIIAGMAVLWAPLFASVIAIALAIYQFLMLRQFIRDYYKK